ncbi:putative pentatricopeptide repeat-containing protein At3g25060, mitochondrial [Camellia sinensis]|nr:putative pentatricopeptide repeat-containing protein At3g25060, mitochondrial [Camellia sinensis]XP_028100244.1 putative pentatricopeptide repeat-containing protein At3g25060, mitochondrial [Camellia sinensis]XP_028100245.1 putative pentatricopeptide repeat-containing protein At3g25060, mitochondrial [Camellia sinensis]
MWFFPWPKGLKSLLLASKHRDSIVKIHALMVVSGIFSIGTSNGQLLASYDRIGELELARKLFDKLPHRRVDVWNAMIIAYSRKNFPVEVVNLYRKMNLEGVRPDSSTFTLALKACTSLLDLEMGGEIRCRAVECGYEYDIFVGSSLLNLYAKCGKMEEAMGVFDKMPRRDLVSWTTMITGFAQIGHASEAINVYRLMQREGMEGDWVVMLGLVQACANLGDSKMGLSVHGYMIRRDLPMDVVFQTSLVDVYAKIGRLDLASRVFEKIRYKNVIPWSALISGYAQNGFAGNALELFIEMQSFGFKPDLVSLVSALLACSQVGFLKLGRSIHGYIVRKLDFNKVSGTAVIDMYSKCGSLSCARVLFDQISTRDSISWNAMIASYGIHGHGKEALSLFLQMTKTNLKPDHATFASLLSALSHSGLVEEGRYWFDLMVNDFKIQPSEKHYACMVDLLARAGLVEEAHDLIGSMTNEPGIAIWVALLAGCQIHRKLLIGKMAAKKVLELNPDDPGIYALVSNFFATTRNWEEVAGVRKVMKETGIKKVPGYSVVEVSGELHAFVMEDKSHPQYEQIVKILEKLEQYMRDMGYDPILTLCCTSLKRKSK